METAYDLKYKKKKVKKKKVKKKKDNSSLESVELNSNEEGYDMVPEAKTKKKKDKSSEEESLYRDIKKKPLVRLRSSEEDDYDDARLNADPDVIHYRDVSPRKDPVKSKKKHKKKTKKKKSKRKKNTIKRTKKKRTKRTKKKKTKRGGGPDFLKRGSDFLKQRIEQRNEQRNKMKWVEDNFIDAKIESGTPKSMAKKDLNKWYNKTDSDGTTLKEIIKQTELEELEEILRPQFDIIKSGAKYEPKKNAFGYFDGGD